VPARTLTVNNPSAPAVLREREEDWASSVQTSGAIKKARSASGPCRSGVLLELLRKTPDGIVFNTPYTVDGAIIFKHACTLGCEGIVSKRLGSPYQSGRVSHWLKIKNQAAPAVRREAEEDWAPNENGEGTAFGKGVFGQ
jgi:hypothetical protein